MYLTVGTKEINYNKFRKVSNYNHDSKYKLSGGLWLAKHYDGINYSVWMDYVFNHKNVLFYKYGKYLNNEYGWKIPCSLVELNSNNNIFLLDDIDKYDYLRNKYSLDKDSISYEDMALDYDGIYIKLGWTLKKNNYKYDRFSSFGVDSLILYNLDCINNYNSGDILIERFNIDDYYMYDNILYDINISDEKKKVLKR